MTKSEIKQAYSMRDILAKYGMQPNRSGFMRCPFHEGDNTPSLKIYKDSFHCFGCEADGDIFDFVAKMEGVSFKAAFLFLGGTYEKPTFESRLAIHRHKQRVTAETKRVAKAKEAKKLNVMLINIYQTWLPRLEPLSEAWTECYNELQKQIYIFDCNENLLEKRGG